VTPLNSMQINQSITELCVGSSSITFNSEFESATIGESCPIPLIPSVRDLTLLKVDSIEDLISVYSGHPLLKDFTINLKYTGESDFAKFETFLLTLKNFKKAELRFLDRKFHKPLGKSMNVEFNAMILVEMKEWVSYPYWLFLRKSYND
jgi:hypothetical protein